MQEISDRLQTLRDLKKRWDTISNPSYKQEIETLIRQSAILAKKIKNLSSDSLEKDSAIGPLDGLINRVRHLLDASENYNYCRTCRWSGPNEHLLSTGGCGSCGSSVSKARF